MYTCGPIALLFPALIHVYAQGKEHYSGKLDLNRDTCALFS